MVIISACFYWDAESVVSDSDDDDENSCIHSTPLEAVTAPAVVVAAAIVAGARAVAEQHGDG